MVRILHLPLSVRGQIESGLFLSLSKSFSTVSHHFLKDRPTTLVMHNSTLNWLHSYLTFLLCKVKREKLLLLRVCRNQGSDSGFNPGAHIFSIYLNSLSTDCGNFVIVHYTDEMVLLYATNYILWSRSFRPVFPLQTAGSSTLIAN